MFNGLSPKTESNVFLTDNIFVAEIYAHRAATRSGGYPVVFRVNVGHMKHKSTVQFDFYTKVSEDLVLLPYVQYVYNSIPPNRIKGLYIPPPLTATLFELICILQSVSNQTQQEEREIKYLRDLYYKRL